MHPDGTRDSTMPGFATSARPEVDERRELTFLGVRSHKAEMEEKLVPSGGFYFLPMRRSNQASQDSSRA